ncbi:hypothetical protein SGRA_3122 [Saprospira grandis str. Lewin]|uniref:Uncharacterized protein n=1 Tax=Saprospira grandis (strain Lewin) TaxID=984262 RepID=H6KZS4_SAPGL|nr:hypothetical protein SGRA_3122 [Saprospira grandis str. Lewin]
MQLGFFLPLRENGSKKKRAGDLLRPPASAKIH